MEKYIKTFESFINLDMENTKPETETITTTRGDVVVSNSIAYADIPTDAYYATREENPRRYIIYTKYILGNGLGYNPRPIVATILPLELKGIPAIAPEQK
jgi:hypothetical protein